MFGIMLLTNSGDAAAGLELLCNFRQDADHRLTGNHRSARTDRLRSGRAGRLPDQFVRHPNENGLADQGHPESLARLHLLSGDGAIGLAAAIDVLRGRGGLR